MTRHHPAMPLQSVRLGKMRRRALYLLFAILVASGALWLFVHARDTGDALPSPLEPWLMKLHGAAAMLIIYLTGTMLHGHMLNAWRRRRNRWSGGLTAAASLLLALSGYGLYYFNGEALRGATEWVHWVIGFGAPALIVGHVLMAPGRVRRAKRLLRAWKGASRGTGTGAGPRR